MPQIARVRFLGTEPHEVPLLGRVVEPEELCAMPAQLLTDYAWPEALWRIEDDPRPPAVDEPGADEQPGEEPPTRPTTSRRRAARDEE